MTDVKEFEVNGWRIKPCGNGFDVVHGGEHYHEPSLEHAVRLAQKSTRIVPIEPQDPLPEGDGDELDVRAVAAHSALLMNGDDTSKYGAYVLGRLINQWRTGKERLARYEKNKPSWAHGTPEAYDAWLRDLTPDDRRLKFYQWIGSLAVSEAVEMLRTQIGDDPVPVEHQHWDADLVNELLDGYDPRQPLTDPFPQQLPLGRPFCDVSHHAHPHGGTRLPSCRLDSPE